MRSRRRRLYLVKRFSLALLLMPVSAGAIDSSLYRDPSETRWWGGDAGEGVGFEVGVITETGTVRGGAAAAEVAFPLERALLTLDAASLLYLQKSQRGGTHVAGLLLGRQLDPLWSVGVGLRGVLGTGDGAGSGAGASLGISRRLRPYLGGGAGVLSLSLHGIGTSYEPEEWLFSMPAFTPRLRFETWELAGPGNGSLSLVVEAGLDGFVRPRVGVGGRLHIGNGTRLEAGASYISHPLSQPVTGGVFVPVGGVTLGSTGAYDLRGGTGIATIGLWTGELFGDPSPPEVEISAGSDASLSPKGNRDSVPFGFVATDDRALDFVRVSFVDNRGQMVREYRYVPAALERVRFGDVATTLASPVGERQIRESGSWDGRDGLGNVVADGTYTIVVEAVDKQGNRGRTAGFTVEVDTSAPLPPRVGAEKDLYGPGESPSFRVEWARASGTMEWDVLLENGAGRTVGTTTITGGEPERLRWADLSGTAISPGQFRAVTRGVDAAGNVGEYRSDWFVVASVSPTASLKRLTEYWSPRVDSGAAQFRLRLEGIAAVESWRVTARRDDEEFQWSGVDVPPEGFSLAGTPFAAGVGPVEIAGEVVTREGRRLAQGPVVIWVDDTPPALAVSLDSPTLRHESPEVDLFIDATDYWTWSVAVVGTDGAEGGRTEVQGTLPFPFTFYPAKKDGSPLAPGEYSLVVEVRDRAGNSSAERVPIRVLPPPSGVGVAVTPRVFSYRNGGRAALSPVMGGFTGDAARVRRYWYEVSSIAGDTVRRFEGTGFPVGDVTWDGRDRNGRDVEDGSYRVVLSVESEDGPIVESGAATVEVDSRAPQIAVDVTERVVSPDGDGRYDSVFVDYRVDETVEARVQVVPSAPEGGVVGSFSLGRIGAGSTNRFEWNGTTGDRGEAVPDGAFSLAFRIVDRAGNETVARTDPIEVATRPVYAALVADNVIISPNGDGIADTTTLGVFVPERRGLERWRVQIMDSRNTPVREWSGDAGDVPERLLWQGFGDASRSVPPGEYRATIHVEYDYGPIARAGSDAIVVDVETPFVAVETRPERFSPDGDGLEDEFEIRVDASDDSGFSYWHLEVFDRTGRFFHDVGGRGAPPPVIRWSGVNNAGERVLAMERYSFVLSVGDSVGNVSQTEGVVAVDVLLIQRGDRYYIQVPGITFEPNSPNLVSEPGDGAMMRNAATLARVAEIFDRFPDYRIQVEGHAVNLSGTEREERVELAPLSLERARTVRNTLIAAGVSPGRIAAVGRGGRDPIVPHDDVDNRWKNRRVDFVLLRGSR